MRTGTKSVLFGVHAFWYHPITVWRAWRELYGRRPDFWETVAIVVHDLGYVGCEHMDDAHGERHLIFGAELIRRLYRATHRATPFYEAEARRLHRLVRYHSRYLAARERRNPSPLCWPDKLSLRFDPPAFYLFRARLSGELAQYRMAARQKICLSASDTMWLEWLTTESEFDALQHRTVEPRKS